LKFSVLIPTRNRLEFLKYAVASVLQQEEKDFEIIIFDNFSEEDIKDYAQSLDDPRIKYFRTDSFVSVTENWNNALDQSSGDWVVMLGDDDCLMKGYFSIVNRLLAQFPDPDFIYMAGFLFAYPNVLPQHPQGLAQTIGNAGFVINQKKPYWLPREEAINLVKKTFNFNCVFAFNMQFALIKRSFLEKLMKDDKFFHSPYPDYYAMTILMLFGERILACPYPLVAVGISPKSFGYYYFNNIEIKGLEFLNNENEKSVSLKLKEVIFPGTDMNNSWLLSLGKIKSNFNECPFPINYKRYRSIQIIACLRKFLRDPEEFEMHGEKFWKRLTFSEKCIYKLPWYLLKYFPSIFRRKYIGLLNRLLKSHTIYNTKRIDQPFDNIQQFFETIDPLQFVPKGNFEE
jgi:glycosyltransferase involved in cell wall biosynthesis